ncbi:MAG: radical SAM family heme chaperone HemW [Spiribacter sp.]|nr:radical SAM family heme chaperone HemW [Spiribacter sp.]
MASGLKLPPLGLYVHLPWCVQKCPYCDFNSHALRGELPENDYIDALLRDADEQAIAANGRTVETLFIGGGTPSLFSAKAISRLMQGLAKRLAIAADAEITLEANPGAMDVERFRGFLEAGVNRLSIGVQSFDNQALKRLGRIHDDAQAEHAIEAAQCAGFSRINVDLMHGLPHQRTADALADVDRALSLGIQHLSHYQLTLEPDTAFFTRPPPLPDDDTVVAIEMACAERIRASGLQRYEISAWSVPGDECRHNLNYWQFGDYLAIGAGAHGKLTTTDGRIIRFSRERMPRRYQALAGTSAASAQHWEVTRSERVLEYVMNALRLCNGAPLAEALERTGCPLSAFTPGVTKAREYGWMTDDATRLCPTRKGQQFLNDLLGLFT